GLAEATLAVTANGRDADATCVEVEPTFTIGRRVAVVAARSVTEGNVPGPSAIVSCGPPIGDAQVDIIDDEGNSVRDGYLGEIVVRSSSVADGYAGADPAHVDRLRDGAVHTGDLGFVLDGELFV